MAIQFTDFSKAPLQGSPIKDIFENVLKGYQMQQEPAKMAEEQKQRQLANQLKQMEVTHKPKEYELDDQYKGLVNSLKSKANDHYEEKFGLDKRLKEAQINKANQPAALKGALAQAMQLRASLNPQSPTYSRDVEEVNNYIKKLSTSSQGVQVTSSPDGGFEVSIGGQGQTASIPGLPKLKTGETYLLNENNKPIGIGKPLSEGDKKETSGRAFFNVMQPFLNQAQAPYSGKGGTKQFESDVLNYTSDEAAKGRIDNLLAADKALFSGVVKENATLGGANTNKVYDRLTKSLKNSEVYPLLKEIAKYQLPQGYTEASGEIFNQVLNQASEAGQNIPAYKPYYFNGKKSGEHTEALKNSLSGGKTFKNEGEMKAYYKSLTPEQRIQFKNQHLGGI